MTLPRKTIRANVALLLTGLPLTGARVFASRVAPLQEASDLPGLRIYFDGEQDSAADVHGDLREHAISFRVEIVAQAKTGMDDTLDDIAEDVRDALLAAAPATWLGGVLDQTFTTEQEIDDEATQPVGICRLGFTVSTYA